MEHPTKLAKHAWFIMDHPSKLAKHAWFIVEHPTKVAKNGWFIMDNSKNIWIIFWGTRISGNFQMAYNQHMFCVFTVLQR